MIAYVDRWPTVEPRNGLFVLTAQSGGQTIQLALTRHALRGLDLQCKNAEAMQRVADLNEPIPFPRRKRKRHD